MANVQASNDIIRTQVVRNYRQCVAEVDPKGGIMDHLIEAGVVSIETKDRIVSHITRQDRCRAVLDELLGSSHRQAFIVLQRALREYYPWIVDRMTQVNCDEDECEKSTELSSTASYVREMRKRLEDVEKNLRQSPTPNVERDLRQQNDYLTASETRFRQQLDDLKSQNRDLRKQLDDTNYKLQLKSKQLSDMQQEIDKHRKDAKSAAVSLEAQLKDSMERERVLAGKVEQAAVIEKLLREEVRLAVQDERTQMTSAPNNKTGAMYNDEGSQVVSGSGYLVALLDTLRVSSVAVYGVTVLRDKLYIARDRSNIIEVFDVNTLSPCCRRLPVNHSSLPQQVRPLDIAACSETSSIYLSDAANCRLHRVDPSTGDVVNSWRVDSRALWGVSVTGSGTAVVCCRGAGLLCEYTSSGQLVRRVRLPDDVSQPVHAVQLGSSSPLFAVSHYDVDEPSGSGARVCVVDETGTVQRALDRLSQPHHLATFSDDGRCLMAVADCGNDRVKLVDVRDLSVVAVVGGDGYLRHPHRLCVSNSRLYIGLWDGRVLVYQLSSSRITGVSQVAHLPV